MKQLKELDEIKSLLQTNNLKNTGQRRKILRTLYKEDNPLSAKELFFKLKKKNPKLKLSTIYRNLNKFTEKDIVKKLNIKNEKHENLFEIKTDRHHHHLICVECGDIKELGCPLGDYLKKVAKENNYIIKDHRLTIYGICNKCK